IALGNEPDLGVVDDREPIASGGFKLTPACCTKPGGGFLAGPEGGSSFVNRCPPRVFAVGLVENMSKTRLDREPLADRHVVDVRVRDLDVGGSVADRIVDDMQLQSLDAAVPLRPIDDLAKRDWCGIDQAQHLCALAPQSSVRHARKHGKRLDEHRKRPSGIGVGNRRARYRTNTEMVVVMGVSIPCCFEPAQARHTAELRKDEQRQVIPALEALIVSVRTVASDHRGEPPPRDRFKQVSKNAIAVAHARPFYFLSLDNQKVAASCRLGRACTRVTVNRSPDSRALVGEGAARKRGGRGASIGPESAIVSLWFPTRGFSRSN